MIRSSLLLLLLLPAGLAAQPLTLEQCIKRALKQNTGVLVAEQSLRRSEADVKSARSSRLPSANATLFGFGRSRTGPAVRIQENPTGELDSDTGQRIFQEEKTRIPAIDRNSYSFSASLSHTFYDAGRRANDHKAARHNLDSSESNFQARRAEVVASVKRRYYELLKAAELVQVQEESLKLSEKQLENARVRLQVGSGTEVDVLRLQVALDNAQSQLINAEQGVFLGKAQLNHVMGEDVRAPLKVARLQEVEWKMPVAQDSLPKIVARVATRNPALQSLNQAVVASEYNLKAARAAWYPRVSGSLSYSRNNEVFDRVYQDLDQNYRLNLGMSLTYNMFDGGLRQANIDRSWVALESARMNARQQEREIALQIETAYLELVRLEKILRLGERTVKLAEEDLRLAEERYRVGKGRLLEVLDAHVGFTEARSNLVRTRYDLKIAEADLEYLTGG
jgi:outer membrane protein TolC